MRMGLTIQDPVGSDSLKKKVTLNKNESQELVVDLAKQWALLT